MVSQGPVYTMRYTWPQWELSCGWQESPVGWGHYQLSQLGITLLSVPTRALPVSLGHKEANSAHDLMAFAFHQPLQGACLSGSRMWRSSSQPWTTSLPSPWLQPREPRSGRGSGGEFPARPVPAAANTCPLHPAHCAPSPTANLGSWRRCWPRWSWKGRTRPLGRPLCTRPS